MPGTFLSRGTMLVLVIACVFSVSTAQDPDASTAQNKSDSNAGFVRLVGIESGGPAANGRTPRHLRVAGLLSYGRVQMSFDEVPLKKALRTFFQALELDYAPYYRGGNAESGIVSDVPITLEVRDMAAHRALELILAAGQLGEKYSWQLRGSVVEVGTLERLGRSGEARSIVYPIQDLTFDIPYFDSGIDSMLTKKPNMTERQTPRELAAQLMHHIVTAVHSDAWESPAIDDDNARPPPSINGVPQWANLEPYDDSNPSRPPKPLELFVVGRWAKMHYHQDQLIVTAPDFIHRGLNGYPGATMPDPRKWQVPVVAREKKPG